MSTAEHDEYADIPALGRGQHWPAEHLALLDRAFGVVPTPELAARLGRTVAAVEIMARSRRLHDRAVTRKVLARQLGVTEPTIDGWIASGALIAHQPDSGRGTRRQTRVRPGALRDFLRDRRHLYDPAAIVDPALRRFVAALPPARERWYMPKEAATFLRRRGIAAPASTVSQWIRRGDLAVVRVGRRWRIAESTLRAFTPPGVAARLQPVSPERQALRARNKAALKPKETEHAA